MVLFIMRKEKFDKQFQIDPSEIGLMTELLLGQEVYIAVWHEDVGRDDLARGKQNVAQVVERLEQRLNTVREEGAEGIFITASGDIWQEIDLVHEIRALQLDPEYDASREHLEAVQWFRSHADVVTI